MNRPIFLEVSPDCKYYCWQLEVQLHNFRKYGYSEGYHVLVFTPFDKFISRKGPQSFWKKLEQKFPEVKFFYYMDSTGELMKQVNDSQYQPLIRPWCLIKHFESHPELSNEWLFYTDADVLFTSELDFSTLCLDENVGTCFLSYTGKRYPGGNYLDLYYLEGKKAYVKPEMLAEFENLDIPSLIGKCCNITRDVIEQNDNGTGGAQYLLSPGITKEFWEKVFNACKGISSGLKVVNQWFMKGETPLERENNGYQSFCADMWAVLYCLWESGFKTETPEILDFAWAPDPISRLKEVHILHNAGVISDFMQVEGVYQNMFFKAKSPYIQNIHTPHAEKDILRQVTDRYCTRFYADELLSIDSIFDNK